MHKKNVPIVNMYREAFDAILDSMVMMQPNALGGTIIIMSIDAFTERVEAHMLWFLVVGAKYLRRMFLSNLIVG